MNLLSTVRSENRMDETILIEGIQAGLSESYTCLYARYGDALRGVILKMMGQRHSRYVPDILQEIFCKVFCYRWKYDPDKGRLFTWVLNITKNTVVDYLRSKQARLVAAETAILQEAHPLQHPTIVGHIDSGFILSSLSPPERKLMRMKYQYGYTQCELMQEMGITIHAIKKRSKNIHARLRKLYCDESRCTKVSV